MRLVRQVDILDCGTMTWLSSIGAVQGIAPPPREGSAWAFDPKTAKVLNINFFFASHHF